MRQITIYLVAVAMMALVIDVGAQDKPASPKAEVNATLGNATTKIVYCQPSARGRKIMGGLVPYGQVWRTGANAPTTIEFDKAVKVEGKELAAGKYALFTIPNENEWVIIFNKNYKQWGAFDYKESEDVLRVTAKPTKTKDFVETFTISTEKEKVLMQWENTAVAFSVK